MTCSGQQLQGWPFHNELQLVAGDVLGANNLYYLISINFHNIILVDESLYNAKLVCVSVLHFIGGQWGCGGRQAEHHSCQNDNDETIDNVAIESFQSIIVCSEPFLLSIEPLWNIFYRFKLIWIILPFWTILSHFAQFGIIMSHLSPKLGCNTSACVSMNSEFIGMLMHLKITTLYVNQ